MSDEHKIEFVSYDGEYPHICKGQFVITIDDEIFKFNTPYYGCSEEEEKECLPRFWGAVSREEPWDMDAPGEWSYSCPDEKKLPKIVKDNIDEIMDIFNEYVPPLCCGRCAE